MKKSSNTSTILLMSISILLLIASQLFWLKSEYKEHRRSFYNNSDLLFKETVREHEEKLLSKDIASVLAHNEKKTETNRKPPPPPKKQVKPSVQDLNRIKPRDISSIKIYKFKDSSRTDSLKKFHLNYIDTFKTNLDSTFSVKNTIFIRSNRSYFDVDSIETLKKIIAQLSKVSFQSENRPDSLRPHRRRYNFKSANLDSVSHSFTYKVEEMGYPVHFHVSKDTIPFDTTNLRQRVWSDMHRKLRTSQDSINVNGVKVLNPELISAFSMASNTIFKASPINLDMYLLDKLKNNILFSVFLLILTSVTFIIIFRNLNKQERLNNIKNELISNVTHELKTPLATLSVALEALQQFGAAANPQTTKEYLEISKNEVNRLSLMVDNILKASLLEKQAICINPVLLDIEELVISLSRSWQARFTQLDGNLSLKVTGTNFSVEADEVHLTSIINNLIDNALKYSKEKPNVAIILASETNIITLKIKDKGIGIPKEFQSQVFEKFFRVPTDDKHNVKGYGLGLNFVKHIMDLHGGNVSLKSDENGSDFTLTFNKIS